MGSGKSRAKLAGRIIIAAGGLLLPASGCVSDDISTDYVDLNPELWPTEQTIVFSADSTFVQKSRGKKVEAILSLRYATLTPISELPVEVVQESFDGPAKTDTITFRLFSESGEALGKRILSVYEAEERLEATPLSDGWQIAVRPLMNEAGENPLSGARGIHAVGLTLRPLR